MDFIFLGTASGAPTKHRNVSGLALKPSAQQKTWILVDCGEGTQHQLLKTSLSLKQLAAICITHVHGDHCYGLAGVLGSMSMAGRTEALIMIAPAAIWQLIQSLMTLTDLHLNFAIQFYDVESLDHAVEVAGVVISAHVLSHRVPCYAYRLTENSHIIDLNIEKLQAEGIAAGETWHSLQQGIDVQQADGRWLVAADYQHPQRRARSILVAGDNDSPDLLANAAIGLDVLIHEATYLRDLAQGSGKIWQHSDAERVGKFAQTAQIPHLILTHFSARYGLANTPSPNLQDLYQEAADQYRGRLYLANDFDHYRLDREGHLQLLAKS